MSNLESVVEWFGQLQAGNPDAVQNFGNATFTDWWG